VEWYPASEYPPEDGSYLAIVRKDGCLRMAIVQYADYAEDVGWIWTSPRPVWYHTESYRICVGDEVLYWAYPPDWPTQIKNGGNENGK
jgi:hypothetical protein